MAQGTLWFQPIAHIFGSTGLNVAGAKAYFYLAGLTTPVSVYSDVGLTTAITQPVVADANGIFQEIFLTPGVAYKVDVQTSTGVSLTGYPADNQLAIPVSAATVDQNETAGENLTAGQGAYLSDGSGGKTAGQIYKWDSANTYSSVLPLIGMVPNAILATAQGLFRIEGQVAGLSGLSPGSDYYVSTAGTLTSTAPANARWVGRADASTSLLLAPNPPTIPLISPIIKTSVISTSALFAGVCQGRLTATTAVPVTTADVATTTNVYWTPYMGNNIGLYDGSANWTVLPFTETTLALGTVVTATLYDVFAYNNSGTLALEKLAWTNTTTRATALVLQDGLLVKTGATTRRYLGTFYTISTTQTADSSQSSAGRYLYNYYNQVPRNMYALEATASWNYTTATWREARAQTTNQCNWITGVAQGTVSANVLGAGLNATPAAYANGIGYDSTTAPVTGSNIGSISSLASGVSILTLLPSSMETQLTAVGLHYASWLEWSQAAGTTTFYGVVSSASGQHQSGIKAQVWQ